MGKILFAHHFNTCIAKCKVCKLELSLGLFTKDHVPKAVSDRYPLPDWVRDLNCVRSQALETPSQSWTGSAHCEVIFCSYCAVRADWPMHGFSAHFQNAHARITFQKSFSFTILRKKLSTWITIQNALFFAFQMYISKPWFERALHSQRGKSGF